MLHLLDWENSFGITSYSQDWCLPYNGKHFVGAFLVFIGGKRIEVVAMCCLLLSLKFLLLDNVADSV